MNVDSCPGNQRRQGANQELEACRKWLADARNHGFGCDYAQIMSANLLAARRPKPQTLSSIALQMLGTIERDGHYLPEITDTIRKAIEALPND
jgi:aerobic-type carbon monoxide dehydrogenase small subunit (CoxS/CutS family)